MYAIESLSLKQDDLKEINSWWNAVYRKIFNYNKWESVKSLICLMQRLNLMYMVSIQRINFIKSMHCNSSSSSVMVSVVSNYINSGEFYSILNKHKIDFRWSLSKIKAVIFSAFEQHAL